MDTKTIAELSESCSEVGLFRLVECGIAVDQIDDFFEKSRSFFSLSLETKRAYSRTEEKPLGFFDRELTKIGPTGKRYSTLG